MYAYSSTFNQGDESLRAKTVILREAKTINGKTYQQSQTSYCSKGNFKVIATSCARKGSDGSVYVLQDPKAKEFMMMKANPKKGEVWTKTSDDGKKLKMTVIHTSKSIQTPTSSYSDCLVLETVENGTTLRSYFKDNVVMVAIFRVMEGKEQLFTYLVE